MKALLLAAGLGSRLRPLTLHRPKPLCLFYGQALLDLVYRQLSRAGLDSIAINTHHLAEQIAAHVQATPGVYTPPPHLSYEPEILGTGGCLNPLRSWLGDDHLLIYNGDTIADIHLRALIDQHQRSGADATMVLLPQHKPGTTPVFWDGQQNVRQIGGSSPLSACTFTGVHIISPRLQKLVPGEGFQHVIDAYQQLLQGGQVHAFIHEGFWADLGTPQDYYGAHAALQAAPERLALAKAIGLELDPDHTYWRDAEQSVCLQQNFSGRMRESFVFGPHRLQGLEAMHHCIVYPSSQLDHVQLVQNKIVTPFGQFDL